MPTAVPASAPLREPRRMKRMSIVTGISWLENAMARSPIWMIMPTGLNRALCLLTRTSARAAIMHAAMTSRPTQVRSRCDEPGRTAAFTMAGFTEGGRRTSVQGTRGILRGRLEARSLRRYDFLSDQWHEENIAALGGHGGGDPELMRQWLTAVRTADQSKIITGPDETLETHLTTFAAEQSQLAGPVDSGFPEGPLLQLPLESPDGAGRIGVESAESLQRRRTPCDSGNSSRRCQSASSS